MTIPYSSIQITRRFLSSWSFFAMIIVEYSALLLHAFVALDRKAEGQCRNYAGYLMLTCKGRNPPSLRMITPGSIG